MAGNVIVGVDGSDTAFKAASRAAELAESLDTELVVLSAHITGNTEVVTIGSDTYVLDDAERALAMAEQVATRLRGVHPAVKIRPAAGRGKPGDVLIEEAQRNGAQLLVVGNVGIKGLGRVLGSVAWSVVHNAPCDVLVVKTAR
ncbi:universal stress protein [Arthrobacter sp. JZ12]|uniref:universal stress protein n=1 Tax=Arthrobacter sp. JZ12 TaxID=2654190 RepID=UPI002B46F28E|nr:universal stress protein [Arthrobacter sp. JZ12]WRH24554.1 universal stress protein [Arthrobacter sp. JZ12]